jgi:uncharacterized protein YndB with AHSA1/START domain/DNA gyrase inhibitor GyrI
VPKFNVDKSIHIAAPIKTVYQMVRDFQQWPAWSPWLLAEPDCRLRYPADGKGYSWDGKIVGSGEMEILGEEAPHRIECRLTFLKPWKSHNTTGFVFTEKDGGTEVTWSMEGSLPWFMFWMKQMMTAFIGMDYQRGLLMLKDCLETGSNPSRLEFRPNVQVSGKPYIGVRTECGLDEIDAAMERDLTKLMGWLRERAEESAGPAFSIYHKWDMVRQRTNYTLCLPLRSLPVDLAGGFASGELPSGPAYTVKHTGPYRHLGNAWSVGMMHARAKLFKMDKKREHFEVYENNPEEVGENELVTVVHFPQR